MSNLTATQKSTIKNSTKSAKVLAEKYGVSTTTIYTVKKSESVVAKKPAAKKTSTATKRKPATKVGA